MHTQPLKLHITTKHNDKMEGMQSLSTSCVHNKYCKKFSKIKGSVCEHCYAQTMMKRFKNLDPCMSRNAEILIKIDLTKRKDLIPQINAAFFRFEAFGDLHNELHAKNFFTIARANPDTNFALWTKNPRLIARVITDGNEKPDNLRIIVSSLFLNKIDDIDYPFIDKIFTVFDKEHADGVQINCGSKRCIDCKLCYKKNKVKYINEKLK